MTVLSTGTATLFLWVALCSVWLLLGVSSQGQLLNINEAVNDWLDNSTLAASKWGHISEWDTSEVLDMQGLFYGAKDFNQDIGGWDTSKEENMQNMYNIHN